jgi:iron complex outermembrane receptor protein/hemoglobin/transferrin/lactoferrin receptor protein
MFALLCAFAPLLLGLGRASAQDVPPPEDAELTYGADAQVTAGDDANEESFEGRAHSSATREEMDERQATSAPDALRYEPGLSIQQSAHGQASPYVRGMTGQQVVHLFDGIRLNNAIYRQGPNQYFFTVDSASVARIDVLRGGASTRYGSDALGGALLATPRSPDLELAPPGWSFHPGARMRLASADRLVGGRLELELTKGSRFGVLLGVGYPRAGLLRSGGVVDHRRRPEDCAGGEGSSAPRRGDCAPWVPRFREEREHPDPRERGRWRTQLGTGFREWTYDARVVRQLSRRLRLVAATYGFRELDAPRTDQCPAPEAPQSECLKVARQLRSLTYVSLRGSGGGNMRDVDLTLSYQRHVEERVRNRPLSRVRFDWLDRVETLGLSFHAATRRFFFGEEGVARVRYGLEAYRDGISSRADQELVDLDIVRRLSRGQYLSHSRYASAGAFAESSLQPVSWLTLRGGLRASWVGARAPADSESGTRAVNADFPSIIGRLGLTLGEERGARVHFDVDPGFRAPNLDDLTSRQQVGPGFQFENAKLRSERAITTQVGFESAPGPLTFEAWIFATTLRRAIQRAPRGIEDCPRSTPECATSRSRFSLVNLPGRALILGGELSARVDLSWGLLARASVSYARGDGPNPTEAAGRVPLSRIPPLSGTLELRYGHESSGLYLGGALRWAARQTRLAPSDLSDARIPIGGSSGYAVVDLRAGIRIDEHFRVNLVAENLLDAAYRVHGSSVNGRGRGLLLGLDARL